jgi:hypothetical protein
MLEFAKFSQDFSAAYSAVIAGLLSHQLPTTVCTIYDPSFEQADQNTIASTAITNGLSIIELRQIFTSPEDYANPIEPSSVGSAKLAEVITAIVQNNDFIDSEPRTPRTIVFGGRAV